MLGTFRRFFPAGLCNRREFLWNRLGFLSTASTRNKRGSLELEEVQKVLRDVKADDVRVIHVGDQCNCTDHIVIATGRSTWHVKNIAQALLYKAKQKQKGADRMILPGVEGQVGGKWVVIDSGTVIVHALDEKARAYYDLESHLSKERTPKASIQDLEKVFVKIRPINNSKKKPAKVE
ncbi:protein Iojap-related, mitochondrial [Phalaenopsis equestris]|uniref:protein Iojap-related, mitochondrial n=1 Tax=Phalaenopsis equestris TaxID=78828 RepID=UPI0009E1B9C9|nr:protein Iojap-related, mitochondrial [Phalaenopsis equestris]